MTELQKLAIAGVTFCFATLIFIFANMMVVHRINRERDRDAYFWMVISLVSGFLAIHLAKYL